MERHSDSELNEGITCRVLAQSPLIPKNKMKH